MSSTRPSCCASGSSRCATGGSSTRAPRPSWSPGTPARSPCASGSRPPTGLRGGHPAGAQPAARRHRRDPGARRGRRPRHPGGDRACRRLAGRHRPTGPGRPPGRHPRPRGRPAHPARPRPHRPDGSSVMSTAIVATTARDRGRGRPTPQAPLRDPPAAHHRAAAADPRHAHAHLRARLPDHLDADHRRRLRHRARRGVPGQPVALVRRVVLHRRDRRDRADHAAGAHRVVPRARRAAPVRRVRVPALVVRAGRAGAGADRHRGRRATAARGRRPRLRAARGARPAPGRRRHRRRIGGVHQHRRAARHRCCPRLVRPRRSG